MDLGRGIDRSTDAVVIGQVLADSSIGIAALTSDGVLSVVNDHLAAIMGRQVEDMIGRRAHEVLHRTDVGEPAGCSFDQAIAAGSAVEIEGDTFRTGAGSLTPVTWIAAPLSTGGGVSMVVRDDSIRRARAVVDAVLQEQGRADLVQARASVSELEWLANVAQAVSSSLDEREIMLRLARLLADRLADVVIVDLHAEDGSIQRLGGAVAPGSLLDLDEILDRPEITRSIPAVSASASTVLRAQPLQVDGPEIFDPSMFSESSRALLATVDARSVLVVPLSVRSRVSGAFVLIRRSAASPFVAADRVLADDVAKRAALAMDNARLYREQRNTALQLQHELLPTVAGGFPVHTATRYLPARARYSVGGDWFDQFACPHVPERTVLIIGDVAGHDLPAAATMAALRNLLRGVTIAVESSCAQVVTAVDSNLEALAVHGTASTLVLTVEPVADEMWKLNWSNAGHPPPLLLLPDGTAEYLDAIHGPILGTGARPRRHEDHRLLPGGATLILFTDGLIETRTEDIDTGLARLRASALAAAQLRSTPAAFLDELLALNAATDEDDTAVLICHLPERMRN